MFYENLTSLCAENGTTVTRLLIELNLSTSKGTAWRKGAIPKGNILEKIAKRFDVSVDYLLRLTNEDDFLINLTDDKKRLLYLYDNLNDREQGYIIGKMEAMTEEKPQK